MAQEFDSKIITIFLNGNLHDKCEITWCNTLTVDEIINESKSAFNIGHTVKCRLFDSTGGEIDDDDVEYVNSDEPLFLSQGEEFSKNSSLAIYQEIRPLGEGGFGCVKLYRNRITKQEVAIKFVQFTSLESPEDINRVYTEINLLRDLRHPNIVSLIDAFPSNDQICFVMEYCSGGELKNYLIENGPLSEDEVYNLTAQICEAMRYCHQSKVIHRDLKLENILLANKFSNQLKIVDFGIAGIFSVGRKGERSNAGSLMYAPPEMVSGKDNSASPAFDVWSMGCIFYTLLTGNHPFDDENSKNIITRIVKVDYHPFPDTLSASWKKLVRGMLRKEPKNRWNLIRITEHLWKFKMNPNAQDSSESDENKELEEKKEQPLRMNSLKQIPQAKLTQKSKSGVFKSKSVSDPPIARKSVPAANLK